MSSEQGIIAKEVIAENADGQRYESWCRKFEYCSATNEEALIASIHLNI